MNKNTQAQVQLKTHGARILHWPRGRFDGLRALLSSRAFRQEWRQERTLDRALDAALHKNDNRIGDNDGRMERRLLARMGFPEAAAQRQPRISRPVSFAAATASLCLGLFIGGMFGDIGTVQTDYAGVSDAAWESVADDALGADALGSDLG